MWCAYHERERLCPEGVRVREIAHVHYAYVHVHVHLCLELSTVATGAGVGSLAAALQQSKEVATRATAP